MRTRHRSLVAASIILAVAVTGSLSACASGPTPEEAIMATQLPAEVSAKGVLKAALLMATADVQAAVAAGMVTPAEVEAARQAQADGTLDVWRARAEADAKSVSE